MVTKRRRRGTAGSSCRPVLVELDYVTERWVELPQPEPERSGLTAEWICVCAAWCLLGFLLGLAVAGWVLW